MYKLYSSELPSSQTARTQNTETQNKYDSARNSQNIKREFPIQKQISGPHIIFSSAHNTTTPYTQG